MADIELVIKISEEDFEIMKHNVAVDNPLCPLGEKEMVTIIANGIPLPAGHGKLIDADEYIKNYGVLGWLDTISVDKFNEVTPAIIKADRSEEINAMFKVLKVGKYYKPSGMSFEDKDTVLTIDSIRCGRVDFTNIATKNYGSMPIEEFSAYYEEADRSEDK